MGQEAQSSAPVLLFNGILSSHEVIELFELYATSGLHTQLPADSSRSVPLSFFEHCNRQAPLLEQSIHTPSTIAARSPFLFTCSTSVEPLTSHLELIRLAVCTVASRYYSRRVDGLYAKCLRIATQAASEST